MQEAWIICDVHAKPEGKIPLKGLRHIWEDNIKTYLTEIGCQDLGLWTGIMSSRIGFSGEILRNGSENRDTNNGGKFLDQPCEYWLIKNHS
jgi:hypothetical protein